MYEIRSDTPKGLWNNPSVGGRVNAYHTYLGKCSYNGVAPKELLNVSAHLAMQSNSIKCDAMGFCGSMEKDTKAISHIFQKTVVLLDHWLSQMEGTHESIDKIYINRSAISDRAEYFLEMS